MGIQDLYKVIPKNQCIAYRLADFEGMRFAVDISIFLYKTIRSCGSVRWVSYFIMLLCTLKKNKIRAVCIFDGPNPPPEKAREQKRRRDENGKHLKRLADAITMRNLLQDEYLIGDKSLPEDVINTCKNLINPRKSIDFTIYSNTSDIIESLKSIIQKLENQTIPITNVHKEMAKEIVELMGLHMIQADGEAEGLCASLAVKGYVDAVLTEDTDVLAYKTPLMIAFKDYKISDEMVIGIHFDSLLEEMDLEANEFRDLCILLSCDYNDRVKGYPPDGKTHKKPISIGAKYALTMIEEYRTLEIVEDHLEDAGPLIYPRCRELFTPPPVDVSMMIPYNLEPDYKKLERFIEDHGVTIGLEYIKNCYTHEVILFDEETMSNSE